MLDSVSGLEEWHSCAEEDERVEGAPDTASSPAAPTLQRASAAEAQTLQVARLPDLDPTPMTHSLPSDNAACQHFEARRLYYSARFCQPNKAAPATWSDACCRIIAGYDVIGKR